MEKPSVTYITTPERVKFMEELGGMPTAFVCGDLRAVVITQVWCDGECGNSWHIETDEERNAIIRKLEEMIAHLKTKH